jgi:hypothetical protein
MLSLDKKKRIQELGYNYTEIWDCELEPLLDQDPRMKQFFKEQVVPEPLNPRDLLYGGRTCPIRLKCIPEEGEELRYVDIIRYKIVLLVSIFQFYF